MTSDSVSDKLGSENSCLLLYVCSLYHPSLHSTYKCFPYDASNVYTTETGDYKDFIKKKIYGALPDLYYRPMSWQPATTL